MTELETLRQQLLLQGEQLQQTQQRLERLRSDVKWVLDNSNLDTVDKAKARLRDFILDLKRPKVIGAWHTLLGSYHTFCLELREYGTEHKCWNFEWSGGTGYGFGIQPNYARDLKEAVTLMAERLKNMTVEEIKAVIDARTDEVDPDQANRWDVQDAEDP